MGEALTDGPLEVVGRETLAGRVYQALHNAIVQGSIEPGAELNQVALARDLGVSRVPIREALKRLDAQGLVENTPYQKYVVVMLSPERVAELLDLRTELEVFGCRRALGMHDPLDLRRAESLIDEMAAAPPPYLWLRLDHEFHRVLVAPRSETAAITASVRIRIQRFLRDIAGSEERRREADQEHREILAAVRDEDAARAEELIRAHVAGTRKVVIGEAVLADARAKNAHADPR